MLDNSKLVQKGPQRALSIHQGRVSLAAVAAVSVPAIAQARGGSDDPVNHVRREHHRIASTTARRG